MTKPKTWSNIVKGRLALTNQNMTKNTKLLILLAGIVVLSVLSMNYISYANGQNSIVVATSTPAATSTSTQPEMSHRQLVWTYALEWCESGGNKQAVNPKDRDNTPSYGSFQFKPATFGAFAKKYNIATTSKGYMDPEVQRKIVEKMLFDKTVVWSTQFPDCVKKLGWPPRK